MNLLVLTDGVFPFVVGGMQRHSSYFVRYMVRCGHAVTLVHCVSGKTKVPDQEEVMRELGIDPGASFESIVIRFPQMGKAPGHYLRESFAYSAAAYKKLENRLTSFDFVYAKGFSAWYFLDQKKRGKKVPPVGVKFHGYEMFQPPASFRSRIEHWLLRGPVKWNTRNADYVFSYGGKITGIIQSLGVPSNRIIEAPTGIDESWCVNEIQPSGGPLRFVFVGRFERRKGIQELNEVLMSLPETVNAHFSFIGPIPPSARVNRSFTEYYGQLTDTEQIRAVFDKCHVLLVPSHSEGMPNVIMEGMARGLAVVATDVGAVASVVDPVVGWFCEPGNVDSLKNTIAEVLNQTHESVDERRRASVNRIRKSFTWTQVAAKLDGELRRIVG